MSDRESRRSDFLFQYMATYLATSAERVMSSGDGDGELCPIDKAMTLAAHAWDAFAEHVAQPNGRAYSTRSYGWSVERFTRESFTQRHAGHTLTEQPDTGWKRPYAAKWLVCADCAEQWLASILVVVLGRAHFGSDAAIAALTELEREFSAGNSEAVAALDDFNAARDSLPSDVVDALDALNARVGWHPPTSRASPSSGPRRVPE